MNQRFGVVGSSLRVATLVMAIALCMGTRAFADDEVDDAVSGSGKVWYQRYCVPCHGVGGAPGSARFRASGEPVDLRTYVQRHGGRFPAHDWLAVIQDARPGSVHAQVWRNIRRGQAGTTSQTPAARGVLGSIARYVASVQ